jgi:hypothetical protein
MPAYAILVNWTINKHPRGDCHKLGDIAKLVETHGGS